MSLVFVRADAARTSRDGARGRRLGHARALPDQAQAVAVRAADHLEADLRFDPERARAFRREQNAEVVVEKRPAGGSEAEQELLCTGSGKILLGKEVTRTLLWG